MSTKQTKALKTARQLLWRYRHEISTENQPYMICNQADEAFNLIDEALAEQPTQQPNKSDTMAHAIAWLDARDVCNQPSVDEAIRNLLSDHTEDNAVAVVQAVLNSAPQQQSVEWQPIETAPQDGTKILGWNEEFGARETQMNFYGKGSLGFEAWKSGKGPKESGWDWSEPKSNWGHTWKPTHWKPLLTPFNTTLPAAPVQDSDHEFKNFHRSLCERFGYVHDEKDWKRDLVSLEAWIAKKAQPQQEPVAERLRDCDHCGGTGVDGDVDGRGLTIDVQCRACAGSGKSRYLGRCANGRRCLQGCLSTEGCYWEKRAEKEQPAQQQAPGAIPGPDADRIAILLDKVVREYAFKRGTEGYESLHLARRIACRYTIEGDPPLYTSP